LSSAILYVAIVVIWAVVLIPRWLRRDSPVAATDTEAAAAGSAGTSDDPAAEPSDARADAPVPAPAPRRRADAPPERRAAPVFSGTARVPDEIPEGPVDPAHRRVVSARRRLLLMLVGLSLASGGLAGTKMAAWWVIVPPSVMLVGYLLMLREAAKSDRERAEMARRRMARAAAEADRAPVRRAARGAGVVSVAGGVSGVSEAEAKIVNIPAPPERAEEEIYDQYRDAKLRAVGD